MNMINTAVKTIQVAPGTHKTWLSIEKYIFFAVKSCNISHNKCEIMEPTPHQVHVAKYQKALAKQPSQYEASNNRLFDTFLQRLRGCV